MQVKRELFYRCIFVSPRSRRVAHVSAWDAEEAVQLFRGELRTDGVDEQGTIEVLPLGESDERQRAAYQP